MKLTDAQKEMIGFPTIGAITLVGLIIPLCLSDQNKSPWWLLLWIPSALVVGVTLAALYQWIRGGER